MMKVRMDDCLEGEKEVQRMELQQNHTSLVSSFSDIQTLFMIFLGL